MTELWISKDTDNKLGADVWCKEPTLMNGGVFRAADSAYFMGSVECAELPPGHKARLTISEPINCRPKSVPELWAENRCYGGTMLLAKHGDEWLALTVIRDIGLEIGYKCRIAIDEHGIRRIGEPKVI